MAPTSRTLRTTAEELRRAVDLAVAEWRADDPRQQAVRPAGRGLGEVVSRPASATPTARSVRRMQPDDRFDPESGLTAGLFERAASGRLRLEVVVDALTERHHPLLHPLSGGSARVAPVFLQLTVLDDARVVCAGPRTDDGDVTTWVLDDPRLRRVALDLWRDTWAVSRPIRPAHPRLRLSARQVVVARRLCLGVPDRAVARELDISVRSVERDIAALLGYLGARSRPEAVLRMLGSGTPARGVQG